MSATRPLVSVIALFDRGELEPCLGSLLAQQGIEFEALLVCADTATAARVPTDARLRPLVVAQRNPAFRRNQAAALAGGRYLAFIDDDAAAPPDWLEKGSGFLEARPELAGVGGPNLVPVDAGLAELASDLVLTTPLLGAGSRAYRGGGPEQEARPGELHLVNLIVRRDWYERVGGLNEALGYGGEDTEFIHQAKRLGARFSFLPDLFVWHRRRPFGPAYFKQRFQLRRQSARLFVACPELYAASRSFWLALLGPPAAAILLLAMAWALSPAWLLAPLLAYLLAAIALSAPSWRKRPALLALAPAAFPLHHLANLFGLWLGLVEALIAGPGQTRRRLERREKSR